MAVIVQCVDCGKTLITQRRSRKRCDECMKAKDLARWDAHKEAVRAKTRKTEEARQRAAQRLQEKYPRSKKVAELKREKGEH